MQVGLIGRKVGMTRVFIDDGSAIPVTVIDVSRNRVTQLKTESTDGYTAVQVTFGGRRASRVTAAQAGHFAKAGVEAGVTVRELVAMPSDISGLQIGADLSVGQFAAGQKVDVTATSIGKGFSGSIKRHNFSSQRASHGNSVSHNAPGSIGMAQDPGRVFPGKRMAGHLGDAVTTVQNLEIVRVDEGRQLLLVKGAIPGARGGAVVVRPAVKARG